MRGSTKSVLAGACTCAGPSGAKALTICRNRDAGAPRGFLTADFDMIRQYRPRVNVVERPTRTGGGKGYQITGHHEIMVPLLAWAITEELLR